MTPLRSRAFIPALSALVVALVMTGCSPGETTEPSPEPTVATTQTTAPPSELSPTPSISTPDPSPSSTLDEEQTAAADTVLEFFRLLTELSKDPGMDLQPLVDITTGESQMVEVDLISLDRENGLIQTGDDLYYVTGVGQNSIVPDGEMIAVEACSDSSNSDLVSQETGLSVLGPDRAFYVDWQIEVLKEGSKWKVGDLTNQKVERCCP